MIKFQKRTGFSSSVYVVRFGKYRFALHVHRYPRGFYFEYSEMWSKDAYSIKFFKGFTI